MCVGGVCVGGVLEHLMPDRCRCMHIRVRSIAMRWYDCEMFPLSKVVLGRFNGLNDAIDCQITRVQSPLVVISNTGGKGCTHWVKIDLDFSFSTFTH